jgi:Tol biopolymer transport system component
VLGLAPQGSALAPDGRRYAAGTFTRGEGGRLLVGALGGASRTVATSAYEITEPVWSPNGRRVAYEVVNPTSCGPADRNCVTYELWVVPASGAAARRLASPARFPVWSPDGRQIAFVGYNTFDRFGPPSVVASTHGPARRLARLETPGGLAWSPDSKRVAFPSERGVVAVTNLLGGRARSLGAGRAVTWTSTASLAVARPGARLAVVRPDGRVVRTIRSLGRSVDALAASPGGTEVAYLARSGRTDFPSWIVAMVSVRGGSSHELLRVDRFGIVSSPAWSRDGSRVLLATTRNENDADLFTMRSDGSEVRRVTADDVFELDPALAPNGTRIVFTAPTPSAIPQSGLFAIGTSGKGREALTAPPLGSEDLYPSWSRDGGRVAFVRSLDPSGPSAAELWTIRADGTDARRLLVSDHELIGTAWSPDGTRIAFGRFEPRPAVWIVGSDGRNARELTAAGGISAPAWSPNGSRLAFVAAGTTTLEVLDVASGSVSAAATDAAWGSKPAWSPDGSRLAFLGVDDDVHSVASTGGDETDLTPGLGREWGLDWSRASG